MRINRCDDAACRECARRARGAGRAGPAAPPRGARRTTANASARSSPARFCPSPSCSISRSRAAATTSSSAARWGWPSGGSCCWAPWSGCSRCARSGAPSRSASASCSPSRVWTALGISWSDSSERSVEEVARVLTFLGVLALSLSAQDREALRRTVRSVGAAIALVGVLALLSRLEPSWFPKSEVGSFLPAVGARLAYPLNYWNGLAALMALGLPLVLVLAVESRRHPHPGPGDGRAPGDGADRLLHPLSRRGDRDRCCPGRPPRAPPAPAGGAAHPRARRHRRRARDRGGDPARRARGQSPERGRRAPGRRDAGGGADRLRRGGPAPGGARPRGSPRALAQADGLPGGGGRAGRRPGDGGTRDRSGERRCPIDSPTPGITSSTPRAASGPERFSSASGNGRYQYWQSALDAMSSKPLTGIGPGTYEYWWAETGTSPASSETPTISTSRRWRSSGFPAWRCSWRRSAASSWSGSAS